MRGSMLLRDAPVRRFSPGCSGIARGPFDRRVVSAAFLPDGSTMCACSLTGWSTSGRWPFHAGQRSKLCFSAPPDRTRPERRAFPILNRSVRQDRLESRPAKEPAQPDHHLLEHRSAVRQLWSPGQSSRPGQKKFDTGPIQVANADRGQEPLNPTSPTHLLATVHLPTTDLMSFTPTHSWPFQN